MKRNVIVIGGGVAGLAAGALLARGGVSVAVLEKGNQAGGRANCHEDQGFTLNYGPHAMYRPDTGFLARVLNRLGQPLIEHGRPDPLRCYFSFDGRWGAVGAKPLQVLGTPLLPLASRARLLSLMAAIRSCPPESAADISWGEWVERRTRNRLVRRFLMALTTLNTYVRPTEDLSASFVLGHFQRSLFTRGAVGYMNKGWATMHRRFLDAIVEHGGEVITGARVQAIEMSGGARRGGRHPGRPLRRRSLCAGDPATGDSGPHGARLAPRRGGRPLGAASGRPRPLHRPRFLAPAAR